MHRYYLIVIYGGVEIEKVGPFVTADARDRRALDVHKNLDALDSLFWLDCHPKRATTGSYPAIFFEEEEQRHAQAG